MLQLINISKSYGNQVLFENLTCSINRGDKIGLVGRNGSGKTTLFNIILGITSPDSGEIKYTSGYTIGNLKQVIEFKGKNLLSEALSGLRMREYADEWKAKKLLCGLGFSEYMFDESPNILSGGYKIRLNLAKLILSDPDLLLLDEPNNYLDILSIRWLISYLRDWKKELMIISHDRNFLEKTTDQSILIHRESLKKFHLKPEEALLKVRQEEEIHEKTRLNFEKKREQTQEYVRKFRAKARMAKSVQSTVKALEKEERIVKLKKIRQIGFSFRSDPLRSPAIMTLKDLSFRYPESENIIDKLNIQISGSERICVTGKNGIGKTTLLRILAGDLSASSGEIKTHPDLKTARYLEADIGRLHPDKTVYQEIFDSSDKTSREHVRSICGSLMFGGDEALKNISVLSGGEKSRVLIGKALTSASNLLLLDEPTNHLDMESCEAFLEAIKHYEGAVIIVTHNEWFLDNIAERMIVFKNNGIRVFEGRYKDFLRKEGWEEEPCEIADSESKPDKTITRKEIKRQEALLRQKRFDEINPIEKRIKKLEKDIENMEEEKSLNTAGLIEASEAADAAAIKTASQNESRLSEKISTLYSELDVLLAQLDEKNIYFDEELNKIQL